MRAPAAPTLARGGDNAERGVSFCWARGLAMSTKAFGQRERPPTRGLVGPSASTDPEARLRRLLAHAAEDALRRQVVAARAARPTAAARLPSLARCRSVGRTVSAA